MTTVKDIELFMEQRIPRTLSMHGDVDGVSLCPNADAVVNTVVAALDATADCIEFAAAQGAQLIVTHHPAIFTPITAIRDNNAVGKRLLAAAKAGIALMAFHTRLDAMEGGVNDRLCDIFGIKNQKPFADGCGRVGTLGKACSYAEFCKTASTLLGTQQVTGIDCGKPVHRVALLGGSGKGMLYDAVATGADTYLTGEVAHNTLLDAAELGINLVCATHYRTESPVVDVIADIIKGQFPDLRVLTYYEKQL